MLSRFRRISLRSFARINPDNFEQMKKEWENSIPLKKMQKNLEKESHKRMADLLYKNLQSLRIDDEIMVRDNLVVEPVR